jgi:hypothetical protein
MLKGKTSTGFEYEISDGRMNNYELLEVFGLMENDATLMPKAVTMLLGKDQAEQLKNHVRDEDGLVPADKMGDELKDIFAGQNQVKKS